MVDVCHGFWFPSALEMPLIDLENSCLMHSASSMEKPNNRAFPDSTGMWQSFCQSCPPKQDFSPEVSNVRKQVLHRIIIYGEDGVREFQRLGATTSSFWSSLTVWFEYYFHCGFQVWFSGPHTAPVSYLRFLKWMFCLSEKVLLLITIIRIPNDTSIPEKLNASLTGFRILR